MQVTRFQTHAALHPARHFRVVGREQRGETAGPDEFDQHVGDIRGGSGVEVAGRFVREQEFRLVGDRAGNGHPLLLAAGQFGRPVGPARAEAHAIQQFGGTCARGSRGLSGQPQRHHDVLECRELGHQVVVLVHEAEVGPAEARAGAVAAGPDGLPRQRHFTRARGLQQARDV